MMQLEIVCKEIIKPSCSTPPELRNLHLCLFDRLAPCLYMQLLYFYDNGSSGGSSSEMLKESLSKALTHYYPFAGRLRDGGSVDCNDMGVPFLEGKLRCRMSEVMNDNLRRDEILNLLCSDDMNGKDQRFNPLLSVQLTRFECGGEAICVFLSHKLADLATFSNFMNDWASIARTSGDHVPPSVCPQFNAARLFEGTVAAAADLPGGQGLEIVKRDENIVLKRLVFEGSKIAALKAMVSEKVQNPTRVQVLTALIYKAAIAASGSVAGRRRLATSLLQTIDLRTRIVPPLPATLTGNIITFFVASATTPEQMEMELWRLVGDMKRNMEEFCNKYPRRYKAEEWASLFKLHMKESKERMSNPADQTVYAFSSWCRFPLYDVDFGWGKPVWITAPVILRKNVIILMDAKDGGGIEALVSLEKEEMAALEQNEELLSFCELKS